VGDQSGGGNAAQGRAMLQGPSVACAAVQALLMQGLCSETWHSVPIRTTLTAAVASEAGAGTLREVAGQSQCRVPDGRLGQLECHRLTPVVTGPVQVRCHSDGVRRRDVSVLAGLGSDVVV
jgi:hypothetical protein